MYVRTEPVGTSYRNYPAYHYACDACTAVSIFPIPKDAPFRCDSPACGGSRVTIEGEQPFPAATAPVTIERSPV